jgi:hypothetical protein
MLNFYTPLLSTSVRQHTDGTCLDTYSAYIDVQWKRRSRHVRLQSLGQAFRGDACCLGICFDAQR